MSNIYKSLFIFLVCTTNGMLFAQNQVSNSGREFWVGFATNLTINQSDLRLYITSEVNTQATVTTAFWSRTYTIRADSTTEVVIDADSFSTRENTARQNRGIRITSPRDITVFASNVQDRTTDATVVLPKLSIGTGSEYVVNRYLTPSGSSYDKHYIIFVGMEDSTEIIVTNPPSGYPSTIWLSRFQTFGMPYRNANATITARSGRDCKPFAVFFANPGTILPTVLSGTGPGGHPLNTLDHLYTQVLPLSKWSNSYTAMPFWFHTAGYLLAIIAQENNTSLRVNNGTPINLNRGQRHQLNVNNQSITCIQANKPIAVMQFMKTQGHHGSGNYIGDASVVDLNANSQTVNRATFSSPTGGMIDQHFVNILVQSKHKNLLYIDSIKADTSKFMSTTACGSYLVWRDSVRAGTHTIICDSGFVAYAYGQTVRESYIFSVGASYENQFYNFNFVAATRCPGDTIRVEKFGDTVRSVKFIQGNRVDSGSRAEYIFNRPGNYEVKMVVEPFTFACRDTIVKLIEIGGPVRVFPNDTTYCRNFSHTVRLDTSILDSFAWNIPDYSSDTLLIQQRGLYAIYLLDTFGCAYTDTFRVNQYSAPFADLDYSSFFCSGDSLRFINRSTDTGFAGALRHYLWLGDSVYLFSDSILLVNWRDTGQIKGIFIAEKGGFCRDTMAVDFHYVPSPEAGIFHDTLGGICLNQNRFDWFSSSRNFNYPLQYLWLVDNRDTFYSREFEYIFKRSGSIPLTLRVENSFGCFDSDTAWIEILPSPQARFEVNDTLQCLLGNSFDAEATTPSQNVDYHLWYVNGVFWDTASRISNIQFPTAGKQTITLIAVSLDDCRDTVVREVEVKPHPIAGFETDTTAQCFKGNRFVIRDSTLHTSQIVHSLWRISSKNGITDSGQQVAYVLPDKGTFTFQHEVVDGFGCRDTSEGILTAFPQAELGFVADTACLRDSIEVVSTSSIPSGNIASYRWDMGNGDSGSGPAFRYLYGSPGWYDMTLYTVSDKDCKDTLVQAASVLIRPLPAPLVTATSPICEHEWLSIENKTVDTGSNVGSEFYWDWYGQRVRENREAFEFLPLDTGFQRMNVTAVNGFGCRDSVFLEFRVIPQPRADFTVSPRSSCLRDNRFEFSNLSDSFSYILTSKWYFGNGDSASVYSPEYVYRQFDTFDIRLVVTNAFGCVDDTLKLSYVVVHPDPIADFSINDTAQCFRFHSFDFSTLSTIASGEIRSYFWDLSDQKTDSTMMVQGVRYGHDDSTYRVMHVVTSALGCTDTLIRSVMTRPQPQAEWWVDSLGQCFKGNRFVFKDSSRHTVELSGRYWEIPATAFTDTGKTMTYSFPADDRYLLRYWVEDIWGCKDSTEAMVDIYPQAELGFLTDTACLRDSIEVVSTSSISSGSITSYRWDMGNGDSGSGPAFRYLYGSPGWYDITLYTVSDKDCKDTLVQAASVLIRPLPAPLVTATSPICEYEWLSIENKTVDTGRNVGSEFYWDWYGQRVRENREAFEFLPLDTGFQRMNVTAVNGFGCRDSVFLEFRVIPQPRADFFFPYRLQCLKGNIFEPENLSDDFQYSTSYFWDFGIATFQTFEPVVSFPDTGSYPMWMRATNSFGCSHTIFDTLAIDLFPRPEIRYVMNADSQCLFGNAFIFNNLSIISDGTFDTYLGVSGVDTLTFLDSLTLNIAAPGLYSFDIMINSDLQCKDTISGQFRVWDMPRALFDISQSSGCEKQTSFAFDNQTVAYPGVLTFEWQVDRLINRDSIMAFRYIFDSEGTYEVMLEATSEQNCRDTARQTVVIHPLPQPYAYSPDPDQCFNQHVFDFYGDSRITNGSFQTYWSLLDTVLISSDSIVGWRFDDIGVKTLGYKVVSNEGCADSIWLEVRVYPNPVAVFDLDTHQSCLAYNRIAGFNRSSISSGGLTYEWLINLDTMVSTDEHLWYTFSDSGRYRVVLVPTSDEGCTDTMSQEVWLIQEPVSLFSATFADSCFYTHELNVQSWALGYGTGIRSDFIFSDATVYTDTLQLTHRFSQADTFIITQIVTDDVGCADTSLQQVVVRPQPLSRIQADIWQNCLRVNRVIFKDSSMSNGVGYNRQWWIVDENISSSDSVLPFSFSSNGDKKVYLSTEGLWGCVTTDSVSITILPKNELMFNLSDSVFCWREQAFTYDYLGGDNYADLTTLTWDFGDGTTEFHSGGIKRYADTGKYQGLLTTVNAYGCGDTLGFRVHIRPNPLTAIGVNDSLWCVNNQALTIYSSSVDYSGKMASYEWDLGDGSSATDSVIFGKEYMDTGVYMIRHVAIAANGCSDTAFQRVQYFGNPEAQLTSDTLEACFRGHVFEVSSITRFFRQASGEYWYFPSENVVDSGALFRFSSSQAGTFPFMLVSRDVSGCADTVEGWVTVHPQASVDVEGDTVCLNEFSRLRSLSVVSGGSLSGVFWDLGDGNTSVGEVVDHQYAMPGEYAIRLITQTDRGCYDTLLRQNAVKVRTLPEPDFTFEKVLDSMMVTGYQFWSNSIGNGPFVYGWVFDRFGGSTEENPYGEFLDSGVMSVSLSLTDRFGCEKDTVKQFRVLPITKMFIPNAFSPNANGLNEVFRPYGIAYVLRYQMQIYNRWGELLYTTQDLHQGWDGTYRGVDVPEGVYLYKISYVGLGNQLENRSGSITLLR
jgi:gliding motility-associated-like protein